MSLGRRKHIGWEITCDAHRCTATTTIQATRSRRRTPVAATLAALDLGFVETRIAGTARWVCPLHQTYDIRLGRWVAIPLITERRSPRARHAS
jgi:hypothetical protein